MTPAGGSPEGGTPREGARGRESRGRDPAGGARKSDLAGGSPTRALIQDSRGTPPALPKGWRPD